MTDNKVDDILTCCFYLDLSNIDKKSLKKTLESNKPKEITSVKKKGRKTIITLIKTIPATSISQSNQDKIIEHFSELLPYISNITGQTIINYCIKRAQRNASGELYLDLDSIEILMNALKKQMEYSNGTWFEKEYTTDVRNTLLPLLSRDVIEHPRHMEYYVGFESIKTIDSKIRKVKQKNIKEG